MGSLEPLAIVFALLGAAVGFAADALAHRWPEHEDDYVARRAFDWRTAVLMISGAVAFFALGGKFGDDGKALLVYVPLFGALLVLLATDIDQRLLPDLVTLPLIAFAAVVLVAGASPALAGKELGLVSGVAAGVVFPVLLLVLDRVVGGDLGFGDVKLAVALGFMFGLSALFYGLVIASIGFAVVLLVLLVTKRLGLKTAIPFGPVLIFAAFIAAIGA
jgi:leader peptidase (prepilin peptidase) / N-methyltransferase